MAKVQSEPGNAASPLPLLVAVAGAVLLLVILLNGQAPAPASLPATPAESPAGSGQAASPAPIFAPPPPGTVGLGVLLRGSDFLFCRYSLGAVNTADPTLPMIFGQLEILADDRPASITPFVIQFADPGQPRVAEIVTGGPCPAQPRFVVREINLCGFTTPQACGLKPFAMLRLPNTRNPATVVPLSFKLP